MKIIPPGLRALTHVVRALTVIGALTLCSVPALFWWAPDWVRDQSPRLTSLGQQPMVIDDRALMLVALGVLPAIALGLYALWQLWRLFGEYAQGRVFGRAAALHLRRFAWATLACALAAPLLRAWVGIALTWGNPPGQRALVLSLSSTDYMAILNGAVLLAIATVMAEGVRLAEENEAFV